MNTGENINTIDPDTRADRAKYTFAKGTRHLQDLLDRDFLLALEGRIDAEEYLSRQDIGINAWRELYDATIFGNDEDDRYSNRRPVRTTIQLPVEPDDVRLLCEFDYDEGIFPCDLEDALPVGSFTYIWHPDPEHSSNRRRELSGDDLPDRLYGYTENGWGVVQCGGRHKLLVVTQGHLDSVTETGDPRRS
jgi:hypothetical protein